MPIRAKAKESLRRLFHPNQTEPVEHTEDVGSMPQANAAHDILNPTSLPKISNLGNMPMELKPGMAANTAQSAGGAPSSLSDAARKQAPPIVKAGGAGHVPPPDQPAVASRHVMQPSQGLGLQTPESAGYAKLSEEGPLAPASTPVGSIASSGGSGHPPAPGVAAASVKRAGMSNVPATGAGLAKTGVSEDAALAAQAHALHHTGIEHDTSAPYLGTGAAPNKLADVKPTFTDVGAQAPISKGLSGADREQAEPLLPSGKHSSPATGYVPSGVLHESKKGGDIEQDEKVPTGYLGSKEGGETLKGRTGGTMGDRGALGEAGAGGLGTGALLKEHADASKEQDAKSTMGMKSEGGAASAPEATLPSPAGEGLTSNKGTAAGARTEGAQAPSTLLGRAQEAMSQAAAATSAAGSHVVNKVSEATGMASKKAKETGSAAEQQTESTMGTPGAGGNGTGVVQQVQQGAQGLYEQVASAAPIQRVMEYGQAAAAKASEQAQSAYEAATGKLHESGVPQKAAEHRDAASAKASDLATQAQQAAAQAREVAAQKAAQLHDVTRQKAAELYTQAADTTAVAREQAARKANELYAQAADQAAVARDQAAQALGEGIEKVRNATPEDVNRSRLARGLAMVTLLWVLCSVLGIPMKLALTAAFMVVGGMMLREVWQDRRGGRVGGRGPHGGVTTTEHSAHAPTGRVINVDHTRSVDHTSGMPVNAPAPQPPMVGQEGMSTGTASAPVELLHTEFGSIKVVKPALDAAHRGARAVEE